MSNVGDDSVIGVFANVLLSVGFKRKALNWYYETEVVILVCLKRKNRVPPPYYSCWVGCNLREIEDNRRPKLHECHIIRNLNMIVRKTEVRHTAELLSYETPITEQKREEDLVRIINERLLPHLKQCETLSELRRMYEERRLGPLIVKEALSLLREEE